MVGNITLLSLVGEQAAPILLPIYELQPARVVLAATSKTSGVSERLERFLKQHRFNASTVYIDPYDPKLAYDALKEKVGGRHGVGSGAQLVGNFSGGTKTMAMALQLFLRDFQESQLCYLRSDGSANLLYFFDPKSLEPIGGPQNVKRNIDIKEHLDVYWGTGAYKISGPGKKNDAGYVFEREVAEAIKPCVDEIKSGVERPEHGVQIDIVLRCGNRIGIAELKTGKKAGSMEGIKQLSTFGTVRSIGTYVKKFLIIDRTLQEDDLRALADTLDITLIELADASNGYLNEEHRVQLIDAVVKTLGCERGPSCSS